MFFLFTTWNVYMVDTCLLILSFNSCSAVKIHFLLITSKVCLVHRKSFVTCVSHNEDGQKYLCMAVETQINVLKQMIAIFTLWLFHLCFPLLWYIHIHWILHSFCLEYWCGEHLIFYIKITYFLLCCFLCLYEINKLIVLITLQHIKVRSLCCTC